jgi:hypothetical protein
MYGISMEGQNHTKFRLPYNSHRYGKYMGQPNVDYHIIPIDMESIWVHMRSIYGTTKCGLPYNSHRYGKYMGQLTKCGLPYNSHRYGKYMGQPSVDYHIIPIELVICKSIPLMWITYGASNPTDFP